MAHNPEMTLLDLEEKLLAMVDAAWDAFEDSGGQGIPPMALVNIVVKAHETISKRMKSKLGAAFDPNNPEMALIEVERMRTLLLRQIEQKHRLRGTVSS